MWLGGINGILQVQKVQKVQALLQAQVVIMPAPLVAGAYALFAIGSISSGGYHVGKALENSRYWKTYYRNTHRAPKYPYRTGRYDYLRDFASVSYGAGFGFRGVQKLK